MNLIHKFTIDMYILETDVAEVIHNERLGTFDYLDVFKKNVSGRLTFKTEKYNSGIAYRRQDRSK